MDIRNALLLFALLVVLAACRKKSEISNLEVEVIIISAREGHISNIFALDRVNTHSYNAIQGIESDPWSFQINNADILGDDGILIADPNVRSAIIIGRSTTNTVTFVNSGTGQNKTAQVVTGAKFSIDFRTAGEAEDLLSRSPAEQRDTLKALAMEAMTERFNVSTH